jgi:3,4-dihydroxy 2-butanone 4-phosphate synthase/GTP cyclohydrolase II
MNYKHSFLSTIPEIIEDARQGKMFILVDDENRENEGDVIVSATLMNPDQMIQMINYTSGIICLVIDENQRQKLQLGLQARTIAEDGSCPLPMSLTSIEARKGIESGLSAKDRLQTIKSAINPDATPNSIVTPGHVFPLLVNPGGIRARQGHTEASIEIMKLAGLQPCAVLSEAMNVDGTMARGEDLAKIAKTLGIKISSIEMLLQYLDELENTKTNQAIGEKIPA